MIYNKKLLILIKKLLKKLYKDYLRKKEMLNTDPYNYNLIKELSRITKYTNGFLKINDIHPDYFFGAKYFNANDCDDINILIEKMNIFDENHFINIVDYKLNLQEQITTNSLSDNSPYPLFTYVNEAKFKLPTYRYFFKLYSLFIDDLGKKEIKTKFKKYLIDKFISKICNTKIFIYLFYILQHKKIIKHYCDLPEYIYNLWFKSYSKIGIDDSSLFEHMFIGEKSRNNISGFHNWIKFYNEEKIGKMNYFGYIKYIKNIIFIKFSWEEQIKVIGSFFIGTSIEFEIAFYTLLYVYSENKEKIEIIYQNDNINFKLIKRDGNLITVYPLT